MKIPKLLHFIWLPDWDQAPTRCKANVALWADMNPDWEVLRWSEKDVLDLFDKEYPEFFPVWDRLSEDENGLIKKADLARMVILHSLGGVYFDADMVPSRSLESFFSDRDIYCRKLVNKVRLPDNPPRESLSPRNYDLILTREYEFIPEAGGSGVANSTIFATRGHWLVHSFMLEKAQDTSRKVLDYMGPYEWARHVRRHVNELKGSTLLLPPYYMLWEQHHFDQPHPSWNVCRHLAMHCWGNKDQKDWFNV